MTLTSRLHIRAAGFVALMLLMGAMGCSTTSGAYVTHSNFVYPNSNVIPVGPARASVKRHSWVVSPKVDDKLIQEAVQEALKGTDADILLNYTIDTKLTYVPIPLIWLPLYYHLTLTVDGTAAKVVEIGKQELH